MSTQQPQPSYKAYWITWGVLLVLTSIMLVTEISPFSRLLVAGLLLGAMLVKAFIIGGQFMHLRYENKWLTLSVAGTVLFFAAFLIVLISFDALRILGMVEP
jgi:caa(3)-type oxidase subunit IV